MHPLMQRCPMLRRLLSSLFRHREGATAVEFAIVATIFFFLLFTIIEFGMFMFTRSVVESAITRASRAASISSASPTSPQTMSNGQICYDRTCVARETFKIRGAGLSNMNQVSFAMDLLTNGAPFGGDYCMESGNEHFCSPSSGCPTGTTIIDYGGPTAGPGACDPSTSAAAANVQGATILLQIIYPYRLFIPIPMIQSLFQYPQEGVIPITVTTVIKNELD